MTSYGWQLTDLKRKVIEYITSKVKEGAYRNEPGDIKINGEKCYIIEPTSGTTQLQSCSVERLCNIADKIHFRPLQSLDKEIVVVKKPEPVFKVQAAGVSTELKSSEKGKHVDYLTLPLRKMQLDEHIIIYVNCPDNMIASRKAIVRRGLDKALREMGIVDAKYTVGVTERNDVGIWRIR